MSPRAAFAISELSALAPRQEVTHSAANMVLPNTIPLSKQDSALACACVARFSGVSNRANAFCRMSSLFSGFEKYSVVLRPIAFRASLLENCISAACRNFSLTSGRFIAFFLLSECIFLYSGLANRNLALRLKFSRHSLDKRSFRCFSFVSGETTQPEAPSPPSVLLHRPWFWYFKINSRSSSKAHHSCIPACTISIV